MISSARAAGRLRHWSILPERWSGSNVSEWIGVGRKGAVEALVAGPRASIVSSGTRSRSGSGPTPPTRPHR